MNSHQRRWVAKQLGIGNGSVMSTPGRRQTAGVLVDEVLGRLQYASIYGVLVDVLHCFTICKSVAPGTYSIAMKYVLPTLPRS